MDGYCRLPATTERRRPLLRSRDDSDAEPEVAVLRDVVVKYGSFTALNNVTLTISKGATGLVGRNGAGKSTLLRLMLGLVRPASGEGMILGHDLSKVGAELRQLVGYMPENDALVVGM